MIVPCGQPGRAGRNFAHFRKAGLVSTDLVAATHYGHQNPKEES
jgi:hypothetical protein